MSKNNNRKGNKHHYIPQFLQKKFTIDNELNKVRVYCICEHGKPEFNMASIEYNMYQCNMYGNQQNYEKELSYMESDASKELQNMIDNPINYQRKHEKLPKSVLKFLFAMGRRSLKVKEQLNKVHQELLNTHDPRTPEQQKECDALFAELFDINQYFGYIATDVDKDFEHNIYDGEYIILTSKETLFLPDNIYPGLLPLTPHMLLIYWDVPNMKRISRQKSNVYLFKYANFRALEIMTNRIIVGVDTTEKYIKQLPIQFRDQKPTYSIFIKRLIHK